MTSSDICDCLLFSGQLNGLGSTGNPPGSGRSAFRRHANGNGYGHQVRLTVGATIGEHIEQSVQTRLVSVLDGVIKSYIELESGDRQIVGFRFAGDVLLMPADDNQHLLRVEALTPAMVLYFDDGALSRLRDDHPNLDRKLWLLSFQELSGVTQHMLRLSCMAAEARIASFLLEMDVRFTAPGGKSATLYLPMSRRDIADYLALKPETVSRNFTRLRSAGIIDTPSPKQVILKDRKRLRSLAGVSDCTGRKAPN